MTRYRPEHKEATRRRLIETAGRRFKSDGIDGSGIATLVADAGLTNGAFYNHFASKDALAIAAAEHWSTTTSALFSSAKYHDAASAADRVLGYLTLRDQLVAP